MISVLLEGIQHVGGVIFRMAAGHDGLIGRNRLHPVAVELVIGDDINVNPLMMKPRYQVAVSLKMPKPEQLASPKVR